MEDQAAATGDMYRNSARFGHVVFETCEHTVRQTNTLTDTDTNITILCTSTGGEITTCSEAMSRANIVHYRTKLESVSVVKATVPEWWLLQLRETDSSCLIIFAVLLGK